MAKKTGPYIGVTGFTSRDQVLQALTAVSRETAYRLMVGVLMSSKTLAGQMDKRPGRYPKKEAVANIFVDDPRALNLIHYDTDNPYMLFSGVRQIVELAGPPLDGFQFNVTWPAPWQIKAIHEAYPDMYLVLQIGSHAMKASIRGESMERFKAAVGWYAPFIDAVLIDPSGGLGKLFERAGVIEHLRAARSFPGLGVGIAGGLGPQTAHVVEPLVQEFPELSIDAEGLLRTPEPEDALDMRAVEGYIVLAHLVLEGQHSTTL